MLALIRNVCVYFSLCLPFSLALNIKVSGGAQQKTVDHGEILDELLKLSNTEV